MNRYKLVLLGDAQVGKTSLMSRLLYGMYQERYEPTDGVQLTSFAIQTDHGNIRFKVWDTAGQAELCGLRDGYYIGAQCAIIMVDVTSPGSYQSWHRDLVRVCNKIPVVICGNKNEPMAERTERNLQASFGRMNLAYYGISVKCKTNLEKPFLYLARRLTGDPKLELLKPPKPPSLITLSKETPSEEEHEG
ncbi:GTP-binding nuclear protein Ran-2 [Drosophila yakuba]|uniref:Uncharacterized protein n=1 Tax=Drosophila yakuba TaxID=7245 RepID=B4NWQ0_DROYA|nr:GTP-binding nuclear protein Ran-2 [Drosophila yakuba]EDW87392.1 uncharacterized protein Dyak_GE15102 [Drosophila yakuba]